MAEKSLITSDGTVVQEIFWDDSENFLSVIHRINLDAGIDARPGRFDVFDKDDDAQKFNEACQFFKIVNPKSKTLVKFEYDEFKVERNYRTVKTYPSVDSSYTISGRPNIVVVAVLNTARENSAKTGGEAV